MVTNECVIYRVFESCKFLILLSKYAETKVTLLGSDCCDLAPPEMHLEAQVRVEIEKWSQNRQDSLEPLIHNRSVVSFTTPLKETATVLTIGSPPLTRSLWWC